jgi:hypothetical protein
MFAVPQDLDSVHQDVDDARRVPVRILKSSEISDFSRLENHDVGGKVKDFAAEGYIGFQNHDSVAPPYFRNIFIKEL